MITDEMHNVPRLNSSKDFIYLLYDHLIIAQQALDKFNELSDRRLSIDLNQDYKPVIEEQNLLQRNTKACIVFTVMSIESYIYDYSARLLTDSKTVQNSKKLSLKEKLKVIPVEITGKPSNECCKKI